VADTWRDQVAISALLSAYADVVTRRAWTELRDLFVPEAPVRVDTVTRPVHELSGPDELGAFIASAIDRFGFFELVILNARIQVDAPAGDASPTTARARVLIGEIRQDRASGEWSHTYGVYQDHYGVDGGGRWRFATRDYHSLARTGSAESFPFPEGFTLDPP
jgi:hypothetical protein